MPSVGLLPMDGLAVAAHRLSLSIRSLRCPRSRAPCACATALSYQRAAS
jgi:hypothetical protein